MLEQLDKYIGYEFRDNLCNCVRENCLTKTDLVNILNQLHIEFTLIRIIRPDGFYTADFIETRLNVYVDENCIITKFVFG